MRRTLYYCLLVFIIKTNLFSKTIWIKDVTNNHKSMITFFNKLIDEIDLTKFKYYIKVVRENKQIIKNEGDLIIEFTGGTTFFKTNNITTFVWVGCEIDNCGYWAYYRSRSRFFIDEQIYDSAIETKNEIINFLEDYF